MESSELLEWLISEKNMSIRSAKDVISRCGRVRRMLHTDSISSDTLDNLQNNSCDEIAVVLDAIVQIQKVVEW